MSCVYIQVLCCSPSLFSFIYIGMRGYVNIYIYMDIRRCGYADLLHIYIHIHLYDIQNYSISYPCYLFVRIKKETLGMQMFVALDNEDAEAMNSFKFPLSTYSLEVSPTRSGPWIVMVTKHAARATNAQCPLFGFGCFITVPLKSLPLTLILVESTAVIGCDGSKLFQDIEKQPLLVHKWLTLCEGEVCWVPYGVFPIFTTAADHAFAIIVPCLSKGLRDNCPTFKPIGKSLKDHEFSKFDSFSICREQLYRQKEHMGYKDRDNNRQTAKRVVNGCPTGSSRESLVETLY